MFTTAPLLMCCRPLPDRVDDHGAVDPMAISRVLAVERWRSVPGLRGNEPVVSAQPPAAVRGIPLHPAADVAGQERLGAVDAEVRLLKHREAANAASGVRDD